MKADEVKMRLSNSVLTMIDTYFGGNSINEKFINSTLKIILKQNIYKLDSILGLFSDKDGDINVTEIVTEYANIIGEDGYVFDLKEYVDSDMLKGFIPNKALVIKQEDILNLFS
jgi:hypothetical protein